MNKTLFLLLLFLSGNLAYAEEFSEPETTTSSKVSEEEIIKNSLHFELAGGESNNHGFLMMGAYTGYHSPTMLGVYSRFGVSFSLRDDDYKYYIFKNVEGSLGIKFGGRITAFAGLGFLFGENELCDNNDTTTYDTCTKQTDFASYPEAGFSVQINDTDSLGLVARRYQFENSYQYNTITFAFGKKFP